LLLAVLALVLASCGLKVPATIVAGSDAEGGSLVGPGIDPKTGQPIGGNNLPGQNGTINNGGSTGGPTTGPLAGLFKNETEGVTNSQIQICVHVPITGAAPIPHHPNRFGQFYFDYVNQELGGIYGRRVIFRAINDYYNPAGARQAVEQCRKQGSFFFVGAAGTDQIVSVAKWAQQNKVPYLHGSTSIADLQGLDYNVHVGPSYEYQHQLLARMLVKNYGKDQVFATVRVNSPYFKAGADAFKAELKKLGVNMSSYREITVQKDEKTFASTYSKLRSNPPVDIVNNFTTPNIWIPMLKQRPVNYDPLWTAVSPVAGFNIVAQALTGSGRAVVLHTFGPACECATYDDAEISQHKDLPWYGDIENFLKIFKKYSPEQDPPPDDFDYASYLSARAFHRFLLRIGPQPTRSAMWKLFTTLKENPQSETYTDGSKKVTIPVFPSCPGDFTRNAERMGAWRVNVLELKISGTAGVWKQIASCVDGNAITNVVVDT
jgi:hypothetical protein